jgi:hypothetical protein
MDRGGGGGHRGRGMDGGGGVPRGRGMGRGGGGFRGRGMNRGGGGDGGQRGRGNTSWAMPRSEHQIFMFCFSVVPVPYGTYVSV